jgi:hypothetical protein
VIAAAGAAAGGTVAAVLLYKALAGKKASAPPGTPTLTVATDEPQYATGVSAVISGSLTLNNTGQIGVGVDVTLTDPNGAQTNFAAVTSQDGAYSVPYPISASAVQGTYVVEVAALGAIATTSFTVGTGPGANLPVGIVAEVYPTSLTQLIGFFGVGEVGNIVLEADPLLTFNEPPISYGLNTQQVIFKVVDATGKGVPNISVDCFANNLTDDQGGMLTIEGNPATTVATKVTDANGEVMFLIGYQMHDYSTLCGLHKFTCCTSLLFGLSCGGELCVGQGVCTGESVPHYTTKGPVSTQVRVYNVTGRMTGTIRTAGFAIGCNAQSQVMW